MRKFSVVILILSGVSLMHILSLACNQQAGNVIKEGEELARTHCASCHMFPEPFLLDKKSWQDGVLPKMADFMHVDILYNPYDVSGPEGDVNVQRVMPEILFPFEDWEKIAKYYYVAAPDLPLQRTIYLPPIQTGLKLFKPRMISGKFESPLSTLVFIDTIRHQIGWADGQEGKLLVANPGFNFIDSVQVPKGAVTIDNRGSLKEVLTMGILNPSDARLGKLVNTGEGGGKVVLDSLQRPVHVCYADLNNDQNADLIISEFGFRYGGLSWFESNGDGKYQKHILRALPGAVRSELYDFNHDEKPDIIALMAQGDEGVFIYYNEGNGKFREERVLRFPPVYGSNYFQLFDYNYDGFPDILITNGDNADYSVSLKPYHGIRVFLNDEENHFSETFFLPVFGAQKAIPADFDHDGDMDIISIAFFPDYERMPEESFIY
ncbi:MAG: VCBS repeat-containing protein [Bacteroidia bacterium]|nr:VCBS repeat-containing protein [Bacteroidia bacterium]